MITNLTENFKYSLIKTNTKLLQSAQMNELIKDLVHPNSLEDYKIASSQATKTNKSYTRNIITIDIDNAILCHERINVIMYRYDNHYNAILPDLFIMPYRQYSLHLIVYLILLHLQGTSINGIIDSFNIPRTTFLRYYREFKDIIRNALRKIITKHNQYLFDSFLHSISTYIDIINILMENNEFKAHWNNKLALVPS